MISLDALRDGLARGEFFLEYLPTVFLADGRCAGAEALAPVATAVRSRPAERVHSPHRRDPPLGNAHLLGVGNRGEGAGRLAPGSPASARRRQCPAGNPGAW